MFQVCNFRAFCSTRARIQMPAPVSGHRSSSSQSQAAWGVGCVWCPSGWALTPVSINSAFPSSKACVQVPHPQELKVEVLMLKRDGDPRFLNTLPYSLRGLSMQLLLSSLQ